MNHIIELLEVKDKTQTWLLEKLGKSYPITNGYTQNRRQPSIEVFYEIAKLQDHDIKNLLVSQNKLKEYF